MSVCLSVRLFLLCLSNRLTFGFDLLHVCGQWVTTMARWGLKVKVAGQGQDAVGLKLHICRFLLHQVFEIKTA